MSSTGELRLTDATVTPRCEPMDVPVTTSSVVSNNQQTSALPQSMAHRVAMNHRQHHDQNSSVVAVHGQSSTMSSASSHGRALSEHRRSEQINCKSSTGYLG